MRYLEIAIILLMIVALVGCSFLSERYAKVGPDGKPVMNPDGSYQTFSMLEILLGYVGLRAGSGGVAGLLLKTGNPIAGYAAKALTFLFGGSGMTPAAPPKPAPPPG